MDFRFYHLDSNPFVKPASDHLFWHAMHQTVWDGLLERIDARQGIIGILGQAGLGKSTLLQTYRTSVDPKYVQVIDGIDAAQSPSDLLASLARACDLTLPETHPEALFSAIYQHCHAAHACGRHVVLLIDDAHTLSIQVLKHLHELFERLQREGDPLLQIVLCGHPTLRQRCQHPDLYLFEQALITPLILSPLAADDRMAYIRHYLQSASTQANQIFTKGALKLIVEQTHGIPKVINITCSDVLVAGLLAAEKPISVATVQAVLGDDNVRMPPIVRWCLLSAAGLFLAVGLWNALPATPWTSPRTASTAVSKAPSTPSQPPPTPSQAPSQTPLAQAAKTAAQMMTAVPPAQAAVPEPDMPRRPPVAKPPVATQLEAESTIRALRERQKRNSIEPETAVVPAAFAQAAPEPIEPRDPDRSEAVARLDDKSRRHGNPETPPPQPARPALIASAKARLLCAMPRTDGRQGSDIVLLGHTQRSIHRLIDDGSQNMSPVLSPDGIHLAYTSYRGGAPNIYLRNLASGQETPITSGPWLALPGTWSPNGRYLSISQSVKGNNDIFIYDMVQRHLRRLTQHEGIDVSPSFAPDSQRLVFSSDRTGSPQLYITDIAGTPPVRLTRTGTYNTSPSWSPQDDIIAFVGRGQNAKALDLYLIKPDGTQRQRITQGQRFHTPPAWLPDGNTLMGMSLRDAVWERHVVQLNPDEAAPTLPKPESLCLAPQWVAYRAP